MIIAKYLFQFLPNTQIVGWNFGLFIDFVLFNFKYNFYILYVEPK